MKEKVYYEYINFCNENNINNYFFFDYFHLTKDAHQNLANHVYLRLLKAYNINDDSSPNSNSDSENIKYVKFINNRWFNASMEIDVIDYDYDDERYYTGDTYSWWGHKGNSTTYLLNNDLNEFAIRFYYQSISGWYPYHKKFRISRYDMPVCFKSSGTYFNPIFIKINCS